MQAPITPPPQITTRMVSPLMCGPSPAYTKNSSTTADYEDTRNMNGDSLTGSCYTKTI